LKIDVCINLNLNVGDQVMPQGEYLRKHADPRKICERLHDEIKRLSYQCKTDRQRELNNFLFLAATELTNTFNSTAEPSLQAVNGGDHGQ
jgi:hypothetical protein